MGEQDPPMLRRAIRLACDNVAAGGGPFGAVVAKDGKVLGEGVNRVVPDADPTAHAEVVAIRAAARALGSHDLSGAVLYTSCEPCPMCLGAIYWARPHAVYYMNNREDAAKIGFDDQFIYDEILLPPDERKIPFICIKHDEAAMAFLKWDNKPDKTPY